MVGNQWVVARMRQWGDDGEELARGITGGSLAAADRRPPLLGVVPMHLIRGFAEATAHQSPGSPFPPVKIHLLIAASSADGRNWERIFGFFTLQSWILGS